MDNHSQPSIHNRQNSSNRFIELLIKLKLKMILHNFLENLPSRRFASLKLKQFLLIGDKSTDITPAPSGRSEMQRVFKSKLEKNASSFIPQVFYPLSKLKFYLDCLQLIVIMSIFFCVPIYLCFDVQLEDVMPKTLLLTALVMLILDVFVNFNTGFFSRGELITSRREIACNYARHLLVTDLLCILTIMIFFFTNSKTMHSIMVLTFIKTKNFIKFFKKVEERIRMNNLALHILQLSKLVLIILYFVHLFACLWVLVGSQYESNVSS